MASRKGAAVAIVKDEPEEVLADEPSEGEPAPIDPYQLEQLTDRTRPIVHMWGQVTMNRIGELRLNGAHEWARMLEDMYRIVGMSVGEE